MFASTLFIAAFVLTVATPPVRAAWPESAVATDECSPFGQAGNTTVSLGGQGVQKVWAMNVSRGTTLVTFTCVSLSFTTLFLPADVQPDFSLLLVAVAADKRKAGLATFDNSFWSGNKSVSVAGVAELQLWSRINNFAELANKLMDITGYPLVSAFFS